MSGKRYIEPFRPDVEEQRRKDRVAFYNRKSQSLGGFGPFSIKAGGQSWDFEFHGVCGPVAVHRQTGDPLKKQPRVDGPFWGAFDQWAKAGCYVDQFRRCFAPATQRGDE